MTENICGSENTTTGEPCQHPAGSCPVPSHSNPNADNPQGRPSELDQYEDDILEAARAGLTKEGCAQMAGVAESTLYKWLDDHPEFSEAFKRARARGQLQHVQNPNDPGHSRFVLERSFGYTKTERREIEAAVDQTTTHELGEGERELALETIRALQEQTADE